MGMNASTVTLAAAVVVICLAGTLVAFGVGTAMDEPETYPEYTVAGTWEDGTALTGTAACRDTGESSVQKVLGFSYVLEHADGETTTLESFLILGSEGTPVEVYTEIGTAETLGKAVTLWLDPDGRFTYHIDRDDNILAVDIRSDGISATATAVQATP